MAIAAPSASSGMIQPDEIFASAAVDTTAAWSEIGERDTTEVTHDRDLAVPGAAPDRTGGDHQQRGHQAEGAGADDC